MRFEWFTAGTGSSSGCQSQLQLYLEPFPANWSRHHQEAAEAAQEVTTEVAAVAQEATKGAQQAALDALWELEQLPGVGHKTASVVMSQGFGCPAFPVDTHIHRLAHRWGLSNGKNVMKTERDLKSIFPETSWNKLHLQIIYWGREHCQARACFGLECHICKSCYPKRKNPIRHKRG